MTSEKTTEAKPTQAKPSGEQPTGIGPAEDTFALLRPPVRISRRAVGAAGVLAGMVVVALGLFSARDQKGPSSRPSPPDIREVLPDFLDEELAKALGREPSPPEPRARAQAEGYDFLKGRGAPAAAPTGPPARVLPPSRPAIGASSSRIAQPTPAEQAYAKALTAPLWSASARSPQQADEDPVSRALLQALETSPGNNSLRAAQNGQEEVLSFTRGVDAEPGDMPGGRSDVLRLQAPASPYVIPEGTLIPARLITGATTEAPGSLVAQVSRDVYDQAQRHLLLPAGSRLIGRYEDQVAYGSGRLVVAWTRLLLPDGRFIRLPGFAAHSQSGEAGVPGRLHRRFWEAFAPALLVSALGAVAELPALLLQKEGATSINVTLGGGGLASQVTSELGQAATQLMQRRGEVRPRIEVSPGSPLVVFVSQDLIFEGPYGYHEE